MYTYGAFSFVALSRMRPFPPETVCYATQHALSAVSHNRHVCGVMLQTCLLSRTACMSPASHGNLLGWDGIRPYIKTSTIQKQVQKKL